MFTFESLRGNPNTLLALNKERRVEDGHRFSWLLVKIFAVQTRFPFLVGQARKHARTSLFMLDTAQVIWWAAYLPPETCSRPWLLLARGWLAGGHLPHKDTPQPWRFLFVYFSLGKLNASAKHARRVVSVASYIPIAGLVGK